MTHMQQGTPEESRQVRHRTKVLKIVWLTFMGIAFGTLMIRHLFDLHFSPTATKLFGYGYVICGGLALAVFSSLYWRCPVCRGEFTRQSGDKYCEKCGTKYDV